MPRVLHALFALAVFLGPQAGYGRPEGRPGLCACGCDPAEAASCPCAMPAPADPAGATCCPGTPASCLPAPGPALPQARADFMEGRTHGAGTGPQMGPGPLPFLGRMAGTDRSPDAGGAPAAPATSPLPGPPRSKRLAQLGVLRI